MKFQSALTYDFVILLGWLSKLRLHERVVVNSFVVRASDWLGSGTSKFLKWVLDSGGGTGFPLIRL